MKIGTRIELVEAANEEGTHCDDCIFVAQDRCPSDDCGSGIFKEIPTHKPTVQVTSKGTAPITPSYNMCA